MLIDLALDAAEPRPVDISLNSVSGQVAIRLPHPADARVEANTATGGVSNAFEDLLVSGQFAAKRITGTLGAGTGTLRATTVSGSIALLRRPAADAPAAPSCSTRRCSDMPPVFAHGRLRLYLLKLLDEAPRHGYEVIRLLEERFQGLYAPSAGTVYPRLAKLEAEGLVTHATEGGRKVYSITEAGRAELADRGGELADLELEIRDSVSELAAEIRDDVRGAAGALRREMRAAASATATPVEDASWAAAKEELRKAKQEWKEQARRAKDESRRAREEAQQARRQAKEAQERAREEVMRIAGQLQEQFAKSGGVLGNLVGTWLGGSIGGASGASGTSSTGAGTGTAMPRRRTRTGPRTSPPPVTRPATWTACWTASATTSAMRPATTASPRPSWPRPGPTSRRRRTASRRRSGRRGRSRVRPRISLGSGRGSGRQARLGRRVRDAVVCQDLGGRARAGEQREQQVQGGDVAVVAAQRDAQGLLQGLLRALGEGDVAALRLRAAQRRAERGAQGPPAAGPPRPVRPRRGSPRPGRRSR